jgi:hypothetical protein
MINHGFKLSVNNVQAVDPSNFGGFNTTGMSCVLAASASRLGLHNSHLHLELLEGSFEVRSRRFYVSLCHM